MLITAAILLLVPYFFPLWSITLKAPQYPEGLGLFIGISDIFGHHPNDLVNINLVNHYIGMKEINPESIPELKFMPFILGFLFASLILTIFLKNQKILLTWIIVFSLLSIVGLVDFYLWNYDFGHNLNTETAAIIIPGVSYQPPVFGTKQLLNFHTSSYPAIGGLAAIFSLVLGVLGYATMVRSNKKIN